MWHFQTWDWVCWYLNRINIVTKELKSQSTNCNIVPWTAQEALVHQSSSCYCWLLHSGPAKRQSGTIKWEQEVTSGGTKPSCQTHTQPWTDNSCLMASLPYFHLRWSKFWLVEHLQLFLTESGKAPKERESSNNLSLLPSVAKAPSHNCSVSQW